MSDTLHFTKDEAQECANDREIGAPSTWAEDWLALHARVAALEGEAAGWRYCLGCDYEWRSTVPDGVEDDCPICTLISAQVDKLAQAEARVAALEGERDEAVRVNRCLVEGVKDSTVDAFLAKQATWQQRAVQAEARVAALEGEQHDPVIQSAHAAEELLRQVQHERDELGLELASVKVEIGYDPDSDEYAPDVAKRLRVRAEQAEARVTRLAEALRQVEWHDGVCPWCGGHDPSLYCGEYMLVGHAPDCRRQAALRGTEPQP